MYNDLMYVRSVSQERSSSVLTSSCPLLSQCWR